MHIVGDDLKSILARQAESVEVRKVVDGQSFSIATVSAKEALRIVKMGQFAGVGNLRRIRSIKSDIHRRDWPGGSHTTERIRDAAGVIISPPLIVKHKAERA